MNTVVLRGLCPEDGETAGTIFFDAVHEGAAKHYTLEQRVAWAGEHLNRLAWRNRLIGVEGYLASIEHVPVGFMTIANNGHIDLAYVRPEYAGKGVGWLLYQAIEQHAERLGVIRLTVEASKVARPFFERQGWLVEKQQTIERHAVRLTNFKMSKDLPARR